MFLDRAFGDGEFDPRPRTVTPFYPAGAFVVCPAVINPWSSHTAQAIYELAYEQTRAALRPSWFERSLLPSRN
jgi:hypothetical protein